MSVEPIGAQPPECTPESDADGHSSSVAQTNAPKRFSRTTGAMITPGSQTRARRDVITSAAQVRRAPRRQDVYRKMVTVDLDAMAESAAKKAAEAAAEAEAAEAAEEVDTGRGAGVSEIARDEARTTLEISEMCEIYRAAPVHKQ